MIENCNCVETHICGSEGVNLISVGALDLDLKFNDQRLGHVQIVKFNRSIDQLRIREDNKLTFCDLAQVDKETKEIYYPEGKEWRIGGMVNKIGILEMVAKQRNPHKSEEMLEFVFRKASIKFTNFDMTIGIDDLVVEYTYSFEILEEL